jgi:hypothetical protein
MVIADLRPEAVPPEALCHGDTDALGKTLTERAGRHFDAWYVVNLRMARGTRPELPKLLQVR